MPAKNLLFFFSNQKIKKGDLSDLRPQVDFQRLNYKHQIKGNLICHSAAGEESHFLFFKEEILQPSTSG
jgi:hypothetical protein